MFESLTLLIKKVTTLKKVYYKLLHACEITYLLSSILKKNSSLVSFE